MTSLMKKERMQQSLSRTVKKMKMKSKKKIQKIVIAYSQILMMNQIKKKKINQIKKKKMN